MPQINGHHGRQPRHSEDIKSKGDALELSLDGIRSASSPSATTSLAHQMAIPATQVASLPLIPGLDIEDPNTAAGKVWSDTLALLRDQEGYQRSYYGRYVESPNLLQFLVGMTFLAWSHILRPM